MDPVYLDHAATTPVRDEVVTAMEPYASLRFGNPSSLHRWGREAHAALEDARETVAQALGATAKEIRFVRGGTESDNLAVLGSCLAIKRKTGRACTLAVSSIEHSAVLESAGAAADRGDATVVRIAVAPDGSIDLDAVRAAAGSGSATVSVMWVNNETGLVLPVADVVEAVRGTQAVVHTDASQAIGKVPVHLDDAPVDLLTATGHKINGPRGIGILFVRTGTELAPLLHGGGQERGLRPGTEDVAGAVGLATAIRLAVEEQVVIAARLGALRGRLEKGLREVVDDLRINCANGPRSPHVSSVGVAGIADGAGLLMALDLEGIAVSGGSACHSGAGKGSHVIAALYGNDDDRATVRYSFGRGSTESDADHAIRTTAVVVERMRLTARGAA